MENNSETFLLDLGKWAIYASKAIGYLPLSLRTTTVKGQSCGKEMKPEKKLTFRLLSFPVLIPLVFVCTCTLWVITYFRNHKVFSKMIRIKGATELFANSAMAIVTSGTTVYFKILGVYEAKESLRFWKSNVDFIERFRIAGFKTESQEFIKIKRNTLVLIFQYILPIALHLAIFKIRRFMVYVGESGLQWSKELEFIFGSTYWVLLCYSHVIISLWMTFFIKIYKVAFLTIAEEVRKLSKICFQMTLHEENEYCPIFYTAELFFINRLGKSSQRNYTPNSNFRDNCENQLRRCLDVFQQLEKLVLEYNQFFGWKIILEVFLCVCNILGFSFFTVLFMPKESAPWTVAYSFLIPLYIYSKELYHLGTEADLMTRAAETVITAIMEDLPIQNLSPALQLKLQILVTKLATNPPIISASRFFTVNRQLLTSILGAMATFLAVLVQFRDADDTV